MGLEDFAPIFGKLTTPYVKAKKLKFLIEFLDGTKKVQLAGKKSTASRRKKVPSGLEDFAPVFGKLTTPYVMFESKKNSNSY